MIGRRLRRAAAGLTIVVVSALAACGGTDAGADAAARAREARAYATSVSAVTERTRGELATISGRADYRDPAPAASSTRRYAATIRTAATKLAAERPPATVAPQHRALVALYRATADRMEALAVRFASARGADELAQRAQELSGEVQRYSSQEQQLRSAIERGLAEAAPSAATTGPTPASSPAADADS